MEDSSSLGVGSFIRVMCSLSRDFLSASWFSVDALLNDSLPSKCAFDSKCSHLFTASDDGAAVCGSALSAVVFHHGLGLCLGSRSLYDLSYGRLILACSASEGLRPPPACFSSNT